MSDKLTKLWNDYGVAGILMGRAEGNTGNKNKAYNNQGQSQIMPASENQTDEFASTSGAQQMTAGSCNVSNPSDLLPKSGGDWASLNPTGKGDLANVNLLKAGYHIGIDTIGQTLRNANLQIRSETPNPQMSVGPWNQSTITPDFMRPSLELGQGSQ